MHTRKRSGLWIAEKEGGGSFLASAMAVPLEFHEEEEEEEQQQQEDEYDREWIMMEGGAPPNPPHLQALLEAAEEGDVQALRRALDNLRGSVDAAGEDGDTALHLACLYGHLPCVEILLAAEANLEVRDEDGALPLHDACAGGFTEIVQTLLRAGSSKQQLKSILETIDIDGDTPLHHAARGDHADVVQLLLDSGASPEVLNVQGKMPAELSEGGSEAQQILESVASRLSQEC